MSELHKRIGKTSLHERIMTAEEQRNLAENGTMKIAGWN